MPTREGGRERQYKLLEPDSPERDPWSHYVTYCLFLSLISLFVDLQTNSFRPNPSHSANETQAFRFASKLLRGVKKIFSPAPVAALGSPADNSLPCVVDANICVLLHLQSAMILHVLHRHNFT